MGKLCKGLIEHLFPKMPLLDHEDEMRGDGRQDCHFGKLMAVLTHKKVVIRRLNS